MKRTILPLTSALALFGTALTLRAEVVFSNIGEAGDFRGFGSGIAAATLFTTGPSRAHVASVTLDHFLYDPANPPQDFHVRIYQAVSADANSTPTLNLVAELGNPTVDPTPTAMPGLATYVAYSPLTSLTLEATTTYAITIGEGANGTGSSMVGFTDSATFNSPAGWVLGSDWFGIDLGGSWLWSPYAGHLEFQVNTSATVNQAPDLSNAYATAPVLWPPDGRMVPFQVAGVTDADGDPVTVSITAIQQDEPLGKSGADALVNGSDTASVRAARLGNGNGRVYKISFTASDGKPDGVVKGEVFIAVPHDLAHPNAVDDGPTAGYHTSTAP
jgi:hypothetical protein